MILVPKSYGIQFLAIGRGVDIFSLKKELIKEPFWYEKNLYLKEHRLWLRNSFSHSREYII